MIVMMRFERVELVFLERMWLGGLGLGGIYLYECFWYDCVDVWNRIRIRSSIEIMNGIEIEIEALNWIDLDGRFRGF